MSNPNGRIRELPGKVGRNASNGWNDLPKQTIAIVPAP
jgi:hypothetical protein